MPYEPLPELCFAAHPSDQTLILIKAGEAGYYPADAAKWPMLPGETIDKQVRRLNEKVGVSTAERMAMEMGSIAGWNVPGAQVAPHRARALVEDLMTVDPALGGAARDMVRAGSTYEQIAERFKAIIAIAAPLRDEAA